MRGQVSQSIQTAPYDYQYQFVNTTPAATIYDSSVTEFNSYKGGVFQQAISAVSNIDSQFYNDQAFAPYGFEWFSDPKNRDSGYVTWFSNGAQTWTMTAPAIGPNSISQVSQRLVPEEPMVRSTPYFIDVRDTNT
jgi:beta-glucan synthesis-associated protein KRE6